MARRPQPSSRICRPVSLRNKSSRLAGRLKAAGTAFVLEPQVRFEGQPGEQWTMFFHDPCGNPIEIKGFRSLDGLYAA